jgi:hypothetical protein
VRVIVVGEGGHLGLLLGRSLVGTHGRVSVFFASTVDLIVQTGYFVAEGLCLGIKRGPSSRAAESLLSTIKKVSFTLRISIHLIPN